MKLNKKVSLLLLPFAFILFFIYKIIYVEQTKLSLNAKNQIAQKAVAQVMFAQWLKPDGSWADDMFQVNETLIAESDGTIVDFYFTILVYGAKIQGGTSYEYILMTEKNHDVLILKLKEFVVSKKFILMDIDRKRYLLQWLNELENIAVKPSAPTATKFKP